MINERIRFPQVRVIDDQNAQLGILQTRDAIDIARDRGFNLILVAENAQPPVCRIMDYGKFKYEKSKRDKKSQGKSAANEMKSVRLHPATSQHDRDVVIRHSEKFLRHGHKVRVVCQFKGRENAYPEIGRKQLETVAEALSVIATIEGSIVKQGRDMTMNLSPKPGVKPIPKLVKESGKQKKHDDEEVNVTLDAEIEVDEEFEALQARLAAEAEADAGEVDDEEDDVEDSGGIADDVDEADIIDEADDVDETDEATENEDTTDTANQS
jgi:translation initiation factor IF-3